MHDVTFKQKQQKYVKFLLYGLYYTHWLKESIKLKSKRGKQLDKNCVHVHGLFNSLYYYPLADGFVICH